MPRRVCWGCEAWSMTWRRSCARLWIRRWGRSRLARGAWSRAFSAKSSYFLLSRLASWWASANGQASTFCPHTLSLYLRSSWSYSYILISYWATKGERLKLGSLVGPDHGLRHPAGAQHPLLLRPQVQHHILQISIVHLRLKINTPSMRIPHCLFQVLSSKAALPRLRILNLSWRGCSCHPPLFHQVLTFTFTSTLTFTFFFHFHFALATHNYFTRFLLPSELTYSILVAGDSYVHVFPGASQILRVSTVGFQCWRSLWFSLRESSASCPSFNSSLRSPSKPI